MNKVPRQLIPLAILFAAALVVLLAARYVLVPETFGDQGHYRAAAIGEVAGQEMVYAGYQVCGDCHDDIMATKQESNHAGLSCEVCHGPAAVHANAPDEVLPDIPRGRTACPICHNYNPSRPSGFPQVIEARHNPGKACVTCHNPHAPTLPHAPEDCSACHREISSRKATSSHAELACTTCHAVPPDHWVNPRASVAAKPLVRQVCGACHDRGSDSPAHIPRIDIATHGDRYLCWDCHYPHSPEARL